MSSVTSEFPYELRIGVTGHRDLQDPGGVAQAVAGLLRKIDETLDQQDRTPLKWTVISPLAKGADRIVAAEVLKLPHAKLEVRSPFSLEEYRKDFKASQDLEEFERLLKQAQQVDCLWNSFEEETQHKDEDSQQDDRNRGYRRVGESVVNSCEILIAVWNEEPAEGLGGTADIVEYAVNRERIVLWIDANNPGKAPQRIRLKADDHSESETTQQREIVPFPNSAKSLSLGYHQLAAYNRDPRAIAR